MCPRHESFERHCVDCVIESLYGITIHSLHELMDDNIIHQFHCDVNGTKVLITNLVL